MTWVSGESAGKFYWKHHAAFECEKISDQNHESVHLQSLTAGTQVGGDVPLADPSGSLCRGLGGPK